MTSLPPEACLLAPAWEARALTGGPGLPRLLPHESLEAADTLLSIASDSRYCQAHSG